jgi:hypothetical protein
MNGIPMDEKDAKIERLSKLYRAALEALVEKDKIITEMAAWIDQKQYVGDEYANALRKRARAATGNI